jgi:hypothetical protein
MHIGEARIEEPMWVYMSFMKRTQREHWFNEHPIAIREITSLTLHFYTAPLSCFAESGGKCNPRNSNRSGTSARN